MAQWQTSASSNDARESGTGVMDLTGATMTIASNNQWIGALFTNINIDPGSTVTSSNLQYNISSTSFDDPNCPIYAEDTDDASTFTSSANNISGRTRTTATVTWSGTSLGTGWMTTPDISTIIQEVIDRAGWASGNDIAILLGFSTGANVRVLSYDNGPTDGPILNITWTTPTSGANRKVNQTRLTSKVGGLLS